jgi:hypothetical protein
VDRRRYRGYVAVKDAIALQTLDEFAAHLLGDLAEGLLLARDTVEAETARDRVPESLRLLVDRGDLSRQAAPRFWVQMKACGPPMYWPPSWDGPSAGPRPWALRGH